jgi:hypothetical protein
LALPDEGSPKFHAHDRGDPVEESVNWTALAGVGDCGENEKSGVGALVDGGAACETVIVRLAELEPPALLATRVTV